MLLERKNANYDFKTKEYTKTYQESDMATSQVYISTASRDQLRAIARKHFMKESEILEKFISDTYELMKKKGRKVL